jgi:alkylation response protein AidB-like acyl-CoA dehydrogenase
VPPTLSDARAFADSVAGVLDRHARPPDAWMPGDAGADPQPELTTLLEELGWGALAQDPELVDFAGLGAFELGRRLAPLHHVDRLLGGSPVVGDLVRTLGPERAALLREGDAVVRRAVMRAERVASADGLDVHRILELGERSTAEVAIVTWIAAGVGYLAGLGRAAIDMTAGYVTQRRAFGSTLAALAPVQQLLADAATAVRGVELLTTDRPGHDALVHAGPAIVDACAACQQVTGALGYTLEYPLHRHTQRARGLATWNDALLLGDQPSAIAR